MVTTSKFAENLCALMSERALNAPALAKILKTDRSNITRYLRGERLPLYHGFISLIQYFNCSADVLLGLSEYSSQEKFDTVGNFSERLRLVMKETNTTQYRIEKDVKISGGSMYRWLFNQAVPTVESIVKLARYMDVSVDYLLGRIQ